MLDGWIRHILDDARDKVQVDKRFEIPIGRKELSTDSQNVGRKTWSSGGWGLCLSRIRSVTTAADGR